MQHETDLIIADRQTYIRISYGPEHDAERPWYIKRRDGGPLDGTWDLFKTEDEVLKYLRYFLFQREGEILIERESHPEFVRRAKELDKTRQREDGLIQCFAPGSDEHGW